ncbi:hypothetical protein GZ77_02430 [Endozoicomonas montiporae]|uniref:Uncharacterized protein n=2 Tax=Endozoicomonas montiporae TaxID=1027273 RepID=A0A081NAN6_9GAMM|nr:hypothetical protein [Endozoicomonas montiporae]AMO56807.1 hypothetical protein EZMO1_2757 [Endozoicomonas montiporae CL-33]KEQ15509.1 hypothetical protein GZ77_02430 [Endozoicomonas montiporae]
MEPSSKSTSSILYDALEYQPLEDDPSPESPSPEGAHKHRNVDTIDLSQVFKQIPSQKDDGTHGSFTPLRKKQVDVQTPQPGRLQQAMGWILGKPSEHASATGKPARQDIDKPHKEGIQSHWIVEGIKNYLVRPVADFLVKPLAERIVKPVANQVIVKPFKKIILPQAQKQFANLVRHQLLDKWAGVSFDMNDEMWQKIFTDLLLTTFKDLDPKKVGVYQNVNIPKLTIQTQNGPLVVSNLSLSVCLKPPASESTDIADQQRQTTISIHRVRCEVDIPVEYQEEPVSLKLSTNRGKVHIGTDIGKFLNLTSAYTWMREGKNSPNLPRDQTAVQISVKELKVEYSNTNTAYDVDGNYIDPTAKHPVLTEFGKGTATFKDLDLRRKVNLIHQDAEQSAVTTLGGMAVDFDSDQARPAVVALNKIELSDMDDDHNGSLGCELTLQPKHLRQSSSILMRLVGVLLGGTTKISLHAPVRGGDIALKNLKHTKKQLEQLPESKRQGKGYIDIESSNPIIKLILGPLLRSRFTKIVKTSAGTAIQVGAQMEVQLPGLIPASGQKDDDGSFVMTELFDQIGGDLLKGWSLINSRLLICPKRLEKMCVEASREKVTDSSRPRKSSALMRYRKELKRRQHHNEALRASLAITTPSYRKLIQSCEDPAERAEYYKIAHELAEVDPPKSIAIFAALLQRKHYAEEPKTADPGWLTQIALDIDREEPDSIELIIDTLSFAYKTDPFAGSDALCHLLRLVKDGRCPASVVTELVHQNIRIGRFDDSPKALAQTVTAIEQVVGKQIRGLLKNYPTSALVKLSDNDAEAATLVDQTSNLMQRYNLPVPAAKLHLEMNEEYAAERILEAAIQNNDPQALRARIRWEVADGMIGQPRYEDAAKLLLETLSQPELPEDMMKAGQEALQELWETAHDNPDVAAAFCWPFFTKDDHPYNQFVQQLFSIPRDLTLEPYDFVNRIHEIRPLLADAIKSDDISYSQQKILRHFDKLLNNLQAQYDKARLSGHLKQQFYRMIEAGENPPALAGATIRINMNRDKNPTEDVFSPEAEISTPTEDPSTLPPKAGMLYEQAWAKQRRHVQTTDNRRKG